MGSITLDAPAEGFVVLPASSSAVFFGDDTSIRFGFSTDNNSFNIARNLSGRLDGSGTLRYRKAIQLTCTTPVSQGANTFFFNVQRNASDDSNTVNIDNIYITAMYFPNRY